MIETDQMLISILDCKHIDLLTQNVKLTAEQELQLQEMQARRSRNEPLQYILGNCDFMGSMLDVDSRALIPRPETEILVEQAIQILKNIQVESKRIRILDLGTGSGNIPITLAKNIHNCSVTTVDFSVEALELAQHNARLNNVENKIEFVNQDMRIFLDETIALYDLIISNPPYIKTSDLTQLPKDVQQEPQLALDGGEDGLDFYAHIIKKASKLLKDRAVLLMEIGDEQRKDIERLFQQNKQYQKPLFYKDYVGVDRIVKTNKLL